MECLVGELATNENLLAAIASRDEKAFQTFYMRNFPSIFSKCRLILRNEKEAEDVAADIFLEIWLRASSIDLSRGKSSAYINMLVRSRSIDKLRRMKIRGEGGRREISDEPSHGEALSRERPPAEEAVTREHMALILDAFYRLDETCQQIIRLAFFEGFSYRRVAHQTNLPLHTIKNRIRSSLSQMRHELTCCR